MAGVKLEAVRKIYDNGHVALHDATFEVTDGEFVVLVGPSGCGKSTTLRMIAGLESVTAGRLFIGDRLVNDVPASARDIAMVFQNYALYPHMSVYDNMAFALKLRNEARTEIDRRVREAAGILGLEAVLDRRPKQLSGGQRQRVAVGRAIVRKPRVFLFDEPLSNLDAKLRVQMRKEISRLHRRLDATMVYVTHDQVEAMTMGDRIVVMSEGHIQQIGTPLELYEHPANRFVAGFIGSPAMNFLDGTIQEDAGATVFRGLAGRLTVPLPGDGDHRPLLGRSVLLGIRPEHLYLADGPYVPEPNSPLDVRVEVVEPMGNEVFLYADAENHEIVARVAPDPLPRPDETVRLVLDDRRVHLFDAETGHAIEDCI